MQRLASNWRAAGSQVCLVPTMGYLHEGHLSLVKRARQAVGPKGIVVVSIYVNPTQFGPNEDLSRYPRDWRRDQSLCRAEKVDVIFAPDDRRMYPSGFSTFVVEENLSKPMEGASRPSHFRGVTTVVAKLFNIVQPTFAIFGAKDFQQATVVRRMVRDLNFPLKIIVAPTFRERDGLAMSSRNKYLSNTGRQQAVALSRILHQAQALVRKKTQPAHFLKKQLRSVLDSYPAARLDYIEFFDPETLSPLRKVKSGAHVALAVFFGKTRLIDNARL